MNAGFTTDTYRVSYHGYSHSHLDALCHILYKNQTYNGYAREVVNTAKGCTKLGIDNLKQGLITRGVLLDIPRLKGVPYLEPGTAIYQEDIEAWEKMSGVKVTSGDAILLRTGRWARRAALGPWPVGRSAAGFHASIAPWIKARGVAIVGSDAASEVTPTLVEGRQPSGAHAVHHGDGHQHSRQPGSGTARRDGREAEAVGVHDHDQPDAGDGRHRVAAQYVGDVLSPRLKAAG